MEGGRQGREQTGVTDARGAFLGLIPPDRMITMNPGTTLVGELGMPSSGSSCRDPRRPDPRRGVRLSAVPSALPSSSNQDASPASNVA
jgi:hypothetical protein